MHCMSCIMTHTFLHFHTLPGVLFVSLLCLVFKLLHQYNTRANSKKKMENLEQENRELREEVISLRTGMANLTTMVEQLVAAPNQPLPPPPSPRIIPSQQTIIISELQDAHVYIVPMISTV